MNIDLSQAVERLGELRARRQAIEVEESRLAQSVRTQMSEHGLERVASKRFEARLIRQQRLTVAPAALRKLVSAADFLKCVNVTVTSARRHVAEKKLQQISETTEAVQLRIAERASSPNRSGRNTTHHANH
ncbi:MAG: hypothetical protein ACLFVU_07305 [Phycisphaerae bacterium]